MHNHNSQNHHKSRLYSDWHFHYNTHPEQFSKNECTLFYLQVEDFITQVTRRDQLPAPNRAAPYPKATEQDGIDSRISWKGKIRSLLCCLAPPQNDRYFRSNEAEAVVIRPPPRALPPPRPPGLPSSCVYLPNQLCVSFAHDLCPHLQPHFCLHLCILIASCRIGQE